MDLDPRDYRQNVSDDFVGTERRHAQPAEEDRVDVDSRWMSGDALALVMIIGAVLAVALLVLLARLMPGH
ncbi:MAG: hypothetical protein WCS09_07545 [Pseudomonadota bacterium]